MSKRRGIISYEKLSLEQKKQILRDYPDGYINHLTSIKTPTGEVLDALIWETEEVIYLVKVNKLTPKMKASIENEDEDEDEEFEDEEFEDELDKEDVIKGDDVDSDSEEEEEEQYDQPEKEEEEED
jgi:hypothetical protein